MEDQLTLLVSLYEEKKQNLERLIKQSLDDFKGPDYLQAHQLQKTLHLINRTLSNLHSFQDEHYEERQRYIQMIAYFNRKMAEGSFDIPFINMEEYISGLKEKIEELQLGEKLNETTADNTILKQAISDLVTKKIKKFTIIFDQTENVWLVFSNRGDNIKITSSPIGKENPHSSEQKFLEEIGFYLNKKNRWSII